MTEKLTDGQVIDALEGLRDQQSHELSGVRFALKDKRHDSTLNRLRELIYELRIAALDAVLAERRERRNNALQGYGDGRQSESTLPNSFGPDTTAT